jgi:hypothetical protein
MWTLPTECSTSAVSDRVRERASPFATGRSVHGALDAPVGHAVMRLQVRPVPASIAGDAAGIIGARIWRGQRSLRIVSWYSSRSTCRPPPKAILAGQSMSPDGFGWDNPSLDQRELHSARRQDIRLRSIEARASPTLS